MTGDRERGSRGTGESSGAISNRRRLVSDRAGPDRGHAGESCLELLRPAGIGRYVTEHEGSPFLPVEYRIDGDSFLLRIPPAHDARITGPEAATEPEARATIIIHGEVGGGPWTVSVRGRLGPLTEPDRLRRLEGVASAWGDDARTGRWFEIRDLALEGHRIVGLPES